MSAQVRLMCDTCGRTFRVLYVASVLGLEGAASQAAAFAVNRMVSSSPLKSHAVQADECQPCARRRIRSG